MKNKVFEINVDFETKSAVDTDLIKIVKGDYNSIEFDLKMDKTDYKRAVLFLVKPSKKNFVVDIANSKAIFTEKNTFDEVGIYYYGIVLYGTNSKLTTSTKGKIQVVEGYNEDNEDITGDDNYPILDTLIKEVTDLKDKINASLGVMNKTFKEVTYDASTGVMSFKNLNNEVTNINLPLSLLISSASYDNDNKKIVLTLANNDTIDIPILDLVSNYYDDKINANEEHIASTSNELYRLKTDVLETGESSGNNIHLEDSALSEMQEVSVDGVCEQKTTTGKNLLDYVSNLINSADGLTSVINEDGSITTTGKPTLNYSKITNEIIITDILEDGQTYTISRGNASNKIDVQIVAKKKVDGTYIYINSVKGSNTFKVNKTIYANYSIMLQANTISSWGDSPLTITNKYMLCKGTDTVDTSFEPFTGNQPSPNPDYPQNISVLTGNLKLTSCGKNLFDINSLNFENVWIRPTGEKVAANNNVFLSYVEILPNVEYILSLNRIVSSIGICEYDKNKNFIQRIVVSNSSSKTIITSTTTKYIGVFINIDGANLVTKDIIEECEPQLEKSNQATPYEPYQCSSLNITIPSNEFVGKLDDTYKDTLNVVYKDDGHYHLMLNKMIGKKVVDGNTGIITKISDNHFGINDAIENFLHFSDLTIDNNKNNKYIILAQTSSNSQFISIAKDYNYAMNFTSTEKFNNIRIKDIRYNTVDELKQSLNEKPMEVYYTLNLNSRYSLDLGIVDTLLSYDEVTNVFSDSDLLPIINVKYYRNFITTIQNLQVNNDALKNELVSIESRLSALENANTNVVDNNPSDTEESEVTE